MVSRALLVAVALQYLGLRDVVQVAGFSLGGLGQQQLQPHKHHRNSRPTLVQRYIAELEHPTWVQPTICLRASQQDEVEGFVEAEDLPAIQALFTKYCDKDGLMTKSALESVPMISDMLADEDLLPEELDDIWAAAPKFPDVETADVRIDVDSFVQVYRDVDDLFEEEEDENDPAALKEQTRKAKALSSETAVVDKKDVVMEDMAEEEEDDDMSGDDDDDDENVEAELETIFASICDKDGLISKETLSNWEEIENLLEGELLGVDEFDNLWNQTPKSPGSSDQLDVDGFLSFNVALDRLFDFEEDEEEDDDDMDDDDDAAAVSVPPPPPKAKSMVQGEDLPPGVLFAALANEDYLVGMEELAWWSELQGMVKDGDLLPDELKSMFQKITKAAGTTDKLDEDGFATLYQGIEDLFEEVPNEETAAMAEAEPSGAIVKADLLNLLELIDEDYADGLPCGLESTEPEQKKVLNIVSALEQQPTNTIRQKGGNIQMSDLDGTWDLIYSSSSAMKFNNGLSGLGGSFPNGRFAGLKQKLISKKYQIGMEYIERIKVTPDTASFDVKVDGDWDIRTSVSLFTGAPSIILNVTPDRVTYGPTSTRADHWKSLGPMNMLDLTYLDDDIRVMRGCTSSDTIFIFKKSS